MSNGISLRKYINSLLLPKTIAFSNSMKSQYAALQGQIAAISNTGTTQLWSPGAPNLNNWTPINIGGTVVASIMQNGTKSAVIVAEAQNASSGTEWGAYIKAVPTIPYKILVGFNTITASNTLVTGSTSANNFSNPMGLGWSDGTSGFWMLPPVNTHAHSMPAFMTHAPAGSFYSSSLNNNYQLTDSFTNLQVPGNIFYIIGDDGTNITISETNDGVTEHVIYSAVKATSGIPLTTFNNIAFVIGSNFNNMATLYSIGSSTTNIFLYDENVAARLPVGPGY